MKITDFSNPREVLKKAKEYLGNDVIIEFSTNPKKKYMVLNPNTQKWVHFGQFGAEDFTHHGDEKRRQNYLRRTASMRGNWRNDPYSANNLSRCLLWNANGNFTIHKLI